MIHQAFVNFARTQLKVKWRHQGREVGEALDCVGLLIVSARAAGLVVDDMRNYSMRPGSTTLYECLRQYCDNVETGAERRAGDILVVSVAGEDPQHTMIWTERGTVIHASAKHRSVVEHGFDDATRRGVCRVFRLRESNG